ncbi:MULTISPECIES: hypothetical protein [unclassified Streptomyces]|uniref:hypothetical protein n=1 Tax=unclassified Streptomyces TaxID=2593676 RepID=UPI0036DFC59F
MLIVTVICLAALAPGAATVWLLHHRGWLIASLAGLGVTVSVPFLLLVSLVVFPPLGFLIGGGAALAALKAYDDDRIWLATAWAAAAALAFACAGWSL